MPTQADIDLHELIHRAWQCAVGDMPTIYLSGPITTGLRFLDAVLGDLPEQGAVEQNLEALSATAEMLRNSTKRLIIDPSPLKVPHWSQDQYMALWKALIERRASEVRFMPGWEYSLGCTLEFLHAKQLGIPALTIEGLPISIEDGLSKLQAALAQLTDAAKKHARLKPLADGIARELEEVASLQCVKG